MKKNIIDIWNDNNRSTPFKVARSNWRTDSYAEVISITKIEHTQSNRKVKKVKYEVLAKTYNNAEYIGRNFTITDSGLYKVNMYDYKNWYLINE